MLPLRRRKRYKKCARTFKVRISPYMADEIESFEGPLADYLQDQFGVEEGAEVEAEVHLYETLPGTTLPDIAREESETPGIAARAHRAPAQLHPLTPKAAGLLLGEPRMGRDVPLVDAPSQCRRRAAPLSLVDSRQGGCCTAPGKDGQSRTRGGSADCASRSMAPRTRSASASS